MIIKRRTFIKTTATSTIGTIILPHVINGHFANNVSNAGEIEKVHIIFKTHLDVGFTNLAGKVFDTYINDFIKSH